MSYTFEDYKALRYIYNILPYLRDRENLNYKAYKWATLLENPLISPKKKFSGENYKILIDNIADILQKQGKIEISEKELKLRAFSTMLNLTKGEKEVFASIVRSSTNDMWSSFRRKVFEYLSSSEREIISYSLKIGLEEVDNAISPIGSLQKFGMLDSRFDRIRLSQWVENLFSLVYKNKSDLLKKLLGESLKTTLKSEDFGYLPEMSFALKLMQKTGKVKGCNILLYGEPGTGKTELAKVLAASGGLKLYSAGESEELREDTNFRIKQLKFKQKILERDKKSCLLFDEAEDIFSPISVRQSCLNKVEINRLLENNPRPVIWTTNNIEDMDRAYVRRFTLAVKVITPPIEARCQIWNRKLAESNFNTDKQNIRSMAQKFIVPPSMITNAANSARMIGGSIDMVQEHIKIMQQAMNNGNAVTCAEAKDIVFNTALANADMDINGLCQRLKQLGRMDFSLCLYGAPGTGKSAYARYLAKELGLAVIQKKISQLQSMWLGGTEKNIAAAFAQAKAEKALLIFDEADSLLQDRGRAQRSWEITQVNEMLTWMESHPYPFVCTTNLMDTLDKASLRRFTFKVKYDFLTPEQTVLAFKYFFGADKADISGLNFLSAGDFAVVKRKAEIMGLTKDTCALRDMLLKEQEVKHIDNYRIGFK